MSGMGRGIPELRGFPVARLQGKSGMDWGTGRSGWVTVFPNYGVCWCHGTKGNPGRFGRRA